MRVAVALLYLLGVILLGVAALALLGAASLALGFTLPAIAAGL